MVAILVALVVACADTEEEPGLTRSDVREIARQEIAAVEEPTVVESGLSREGVEEIVRSVIAEVADPEPELTREDVDEILRSAIAELADPEPGLSRADVEEVVSATIAAIPTTQPVIAAEDVERIARGGGGGCCPRSAQVCTCGLHQVLRRQRHQQIRGRWSRRDTRLLQPGGEC